MISIVENPANGHRERIGTASAVLGTFFFGPIYLLAVGLPGQGAALLVLLMTLGLLLNVFVFLIGPVICLFWGFSVPASLESKWLRQGWRRVE